MSPWSNLTSRAADGVDVSEVLGVAVDRVNAGALDGDGMTARAWVGGREEQP